MWVTEQGVLRLGSQWASLHWLSVCLPAPVLPHIQFALSNLFSFISRPGISQEQGFPFTPIKPQPGYLTPDLSLKITAHTLYSQLPTAQLHQANGTVPFSPFSSFTQSVIPIISIHKNPTGYPSFWVSTVCFGSSGNRLLILAFTFAISIQEDLTCNSPTL